MFPSPDIWPICQVISLLFIVPASLLFSVRLFGHTFRAERIRLLSISSLSYSYYSRISISSSLIHLAFHIPRRSNPRWATFTAYDYEYKDSGCHVSLAKLDVTFWFFPVLLRFTSGSLLSVELDDFRLRVFTSQSTPEWVERLRRNLVTTVLTGEILRLDDLKTKVMFSTITGAVDNFAGPVEKPGMPPAEGLDGTRVSVSSENWHIRNWEGRIYTFGKLDAQLRRSWVEDRGSFVMIAEECRWTKVPAPIERETYRKSVVCWQIIQSIIYFPSDIFKIIRDPASTIDLHVPRTDITFDSFRIRDSELLRHAGAMLKQEWDTSVRGGALQGFGFDSFFRAVQVLCT